MNAKKLLKSNDVNKRGGSEKKDSNASANADEEKQPNKSMIPNRADVISGEKKIARELTFFFSLSNVAHHCDMLNANTKEAKTAKANWSQYDFAVSSCVFCCLHPR